MNSWERLEPKIKLVTCILVSAFVYILTPVLLKSVIDGFFVAMDESAIRFALAVIAAVELSAVASSAVFRRTLDSVCDRISRELKIRVVSKLSTSARSLDWHDFELFWGRDMRALTHFDVRVRWMRYQDVVVMCMMSFVAISMSHLAGALIAALFILQAASAFLAKKRWGSSVAAQKEAEHRELRVVRAWLDQRRSSIDRGLTDSRREAVLAESFRAADLTLHSDGVRSAVEESHRLIKGLGIIGVISFGVLFKEEGIFSVGALWALALVMFRITGPSQNIAKWLVLEGQTERAHARLDRLISESEIDRDLEETGATELYRSMKSLLSGRKTHPRLTFVLATAEAITRIENCFRLWSWKHRGSATARLWSGEIPEEGLWEGCFAGVDVLLLSSQFRLGADESVPRRFFDFFFERNPNAQIWIADTVPWASSPGTVWSYWDEASDRITVLGASGDLDHALPESIQKRSLDAMRAASSEWDTMVRDLGRLSRINTPNSILVLEKMEESVASRYRAALREYDHFVVSPSGLRILVLVNCPMERWETSWQRITGVAQVSEPPVVLETAFIVPANDPDNRGLARALSVCAHVLFRSSASYRASKSGGAAA